MHVKTVKSISNFLTVVLCLHWAWMLTAEGYERWGILGGIGAFMASAPLMPFSPFVAWLFPIPSQVWVYYVLLGLLLVFFGASALLRPAITSDYPHR